MYRYERKLSVVPVYQDRGIELLPAFADGEFAGFRGVAFNRGVKRFVFTQERGFEVLIRHEGTPVSLTTRRAEERDAENLLLELDRCLRKEGIENRGALELLYNQASRRFERDYALK